MFLALSFATGLAGSVFPFMSWFNKPESRVRMGDTFVVANLTILLSLVVD